MRDRSQTGGAQSLTRRTFMRVLGALGAVALAPAEALLTGMAGAGGRRGPIVSFHMDQPYLDWSGTAVPYHPPPGARSGQAAGLLSEEAFRRSFVYV
ncbi:MAG TPA: hypothetical protein VMM16_00090 [Verrucomicrobiae bacterium]|nr:hypothetical protein [Verrucomicrobiae bacterium]